MKLSTIALTIMLGLSSSTMAQQKDITIKLPLRLYQSEAEERFHGEGLHVG